MHYFDRTAEIHEIAFALTDQIHLSVYSRSNAENFMMGFIAFGGVDDNIIDS